MESTPSLPLPTPHTAHTTGSGPLAALDRLIDRICELDPVDRRRVAFLTLVASLVGWPLSALWLAAGEPQFVLGLSWLAISITAVDVLQTTDVRVQQDEAA